jgi:hypothetical protein
MKNSSILAIAYTSRFVRNWKIEFMSSSYLQSPCVKTDFCFCCWGKGVMGYRQIFWLVSRWDHLKIGVFMQVGLAWKIWMPAALSQCPRKAMERVFLRSERAHSTSMASIMSSMSSTKAWNVLEKSNLTTPALIEMKSQSHGKQSHLRKAARNTTGYAAVEGARKMLNEMIYVGMTKYDSEIAKCTAYYAEQCAAMQACRGQISTSNYMAANSRSKILDAQSTINQMEGDIPLKKQELNQHKHKCDDEIKNSNNRLKIVQGDIAVMTEILKMTDC